MTLKLPPSLRTRGLSAGYGSRTALHEISLRIPRGEISVFVGPGGSGKTTLLRTLDSAPSARTGMWLRGEVERADESTALWQRSRSLDESVDDYIVRRLGQETESACGQVWGASLGRELARRGKKTIASLSSDERQLVRLTAVLGEPCACLLLDEPLDGLSVETQLLIITRIRELLPRVTVSLVTHHVGAASKVADHVSLIVEGRLVESAPRADFFDRPRNPRTRDFLTYGS